MILALTCLVLFHAVLIFNLTRRVNGQRALIDALTDLARTQGARNEDVSTILDRLQNRTTSKGDTK